jgi:hypothetical protein
VSPKRRSQPGNKPAASAPVDPLQADVDRLYALPLDEFTPARDELARRLRSDGDRDMSAEVKRLRKPNLIAWALNQVRHLDPELIERMFEAGDRLQEAQQQLVAGGERGLLRGAAAEERRRVDEVVARAEQELAAAGHPATANVQSKLWATVHAAAVSPEPRELLRAGRLLREYEVSDLGLMGAGPATVVPTREAPKRGPDKAPRETAAPGKTVGRDQATREAAEREAESRAAAERKEAERQARSIRRELERARARHEKLASKRADAERRAKEAARQAARAQAELDRAEAALEQADAAVGDARESIRRLESELEGIEA